MSLTVNRDKDIRLLQTGRLRDKADQEKASGHFSQAFQMFLEAAVLLAGASLPVASGRSEVYLSMDYWDTLELLACFNGLAACLIKLEDYERALTWLAEIDVLCKNYQFSSSDAVFDWIDFYIPVSDFQRITASSSMADIYLTLGNTGAAAHRLWTGTELLHQVPHFLKTPEIQGLLPRSNTNEILHLKHPDPTLVRNIRIKDDRLQVRGSWKKIEVQRPRGMSLGLGFSSFVYEGHLYALEGTKDSESPFSSDFWRLNLTKLDQWFRLPSYLSSSRIDGKLTGYHMVVSSDAKAYLFTGHPQVDFFDIRTNRWGCITTTYQSDGGKNENPKWPYPTNKLVDYSIQCIGRRIYVFGGILYGAPIGCNLFLELDIQKREWRRLSGESTPTHPDFEIPGPRNFASSWVGRDQNKIYMMYGDADRHNAKRRNAEHAWDDSYAYDDMWSWDITARKWNKEKMLGSIPSPRTEMACTYNQVLNKVILFGGYSPTVPTYYHNPEVRDHSGYSFYADTFISSDLDTPTETGISATTPSPKWKQVLTRGFPTYRGQAFLFSDLSTGKTFLFGGHTNIPYYDTDTPKGERSFGDLWQLRIDTPGGYFEGVDLEEESRTAKAGPWQRCFTCGSAGLWKKCGGTCNGRAFFCGSQCLKEGWKEHKVDHNCRKAA